MSCLLSLAPTTSIRVFKKLVGDDNKPENLELVMQHADLQRSASLRPLLK